MRILHVLAPAPTGGLERVVADLAGAQRAAGHDVLVLPIGSEQREVAPFLESLEGRGVEGRPLLVPPRAYRTERRAVAGACRSWAPDVIHTHGARPDVLDAGPGRGVGAAAVTTVHGFTGGGLKNRLYEWLQRRAHRRFDAVVAVAESVGEILANRGVPAERLHVVQNAVGASETVDAATARARLGAPEDTFHAGWVGRLSREKAPEVFVEALGLVRDEVIAGLHATIVGGGPLEGDLRRRVEESGLSGRVAFAGIVQGASRLFRGFDVIVLSSRTEGTPMVLLEAMAAGVPVIATSVGGVPEVVGPAEAILLEPDDPGALAVAIERVASEPAAAAKRAAAARTRFLKQFDADAWADAYTRVYERAIERRHGRRAPALAPSPS